MLDIPAAPHHLSIFLGRLIVDELLTPAFLTTALESLDNGSLGVEIIKAAGLLHSLIVYTQVRRETHISCCKRFPRGIIAA